MAANHLNRNGPAPASVTANATRRRRRGNFLVTLCTLVILSLTVAVSPARAERDPLLEVLIRKGVLTPEEAEQVQREAKDLEKAREKKTEKQVEQKVEQKVTASQQQVTTEVKEQVAAVEKKVDKIPVLSEALKGLSIGTLCYIDYSAGNIPIRNDGHIGSNLWTLQRGYLNVVKEITPWLYARWTPDLTQDTTSGNWILRMKYLYAELRPPNAGNILTQMKNEIGLGHTPWHDFEESIYPYRCQGTIPIERAGVFSSADLGINIRGNFGGVLPDYKERVGVPLTTAGLYDGKYGTWQLGVYNGAGYTAIEQQTKKAIEGRITYRPMPDHLPGFQLTYFGIYGKGNNNNNQSFGLPTSQTVPGKTPALTKPLPFDNFYPDWVTHMGYLSYQHPWFILTAQRWASKGNQAGNWTTTPGIPDYRIGKRANSLWTRGYSAFGDLTVPLPLSIPFWEQDKDHQFPLHVFCRNDWFNGDQNQIVSRDCKFTKLISGVAYHLYKDNMILFCYEKTWYGGDYGNNGGTGNTQGTTRNGTTNRIANVTTNGFHLGDDTRLQVVFQAAY